MKYAPIFKQIDGLVGNSVLSHYILFNALNILLPRAWHLKRELQIWKKYNPNHQCVLDSGSGLGQNTYMAAKLNKNWSVKGIDISEPLVAHSNKVFRKLKLENVIFKTGNLTEPIAQKSYDLALGMDIAEYIEDDELMFDNIYEALRPGGAFLLYSHLIDDKNPHLKRKRLKLVEEQVRNGYRTQEIKEKLKKAGFNKVKCRAVFGVSGNLSWNLSIYIPLKMLNLSFFSIVLLPFYYLVLLPVILVLNYIETHTGHLTGTAMFVKAYK
ncbi:MAG: class I SAM-dependent methyltransferase [Bacteroidia bacterium]